MIYDPERHRRRSIRLKGYDYAQNGAYFVTICSQNRECVFGNITDSEMKLNNAGKMVRQVWDELHENYHGVDTDEYIIMPNHMHGIVLLSVGAGPRACPALRVKGQPQGIAPTIISLSDVMHRFKSYTTARYRYGVAMLNWPPFYRKLWQRNYFDRIIRNEKELMKIRQYIRNNPLQWDIDEENPAFVEGQG